MNTEELWVRFGRFVCCLWIALGVFVCVCCLTCLSTLVAWLLYGASVHIKHERISSCTSFHFIHMVPCHLHLTYQRRHQGACEMSFALISQPFGELSNTVLPATTVVWSRGRNCAQRGRNCVGTAVFWPGQLSLQVEKTHSFIVCLVIFVRHPVKVVNQNVSKFRSLDTIWGCHVAVSKKYVLKRKEISTCLEGSGLGSLTGTMRNWCQLDLRSLVRNGTKGFVKCCPTHITASFGELSASLTVSSSPPLYHLINTPPGHSSNL